MIKFSLKATIFLLALFLAGSCINKNEPKLVKSPSDILKEYQTQGVGRVISVPPAIVALLINQSELESTSLVNLLNSTQNILVLIAPLNSNKNINELQKDIDTQLNGINFRSLASISSENEQVEIKVLNSEDENFSEMVVIISDPKTLFCVNFSGNFPKETVAEVTTSENIGIISILNRFAQ